MKKTIVTFILFLSFIITIPVYAADLYVDGVDGSDALGDGSVTKP